MSIFKIGRNTQIMIVRLGGCMKYLFIGNKALLNQYIFYFPEIKNAIASFIECTYNDLIPTIRDYNKKNEPLILVFDQEIIKNNNALANTIDIFNFISNKILVSELMPWKVRIDASTLCQLNCKECYMRLFNYGIVGKGYLKFENSENLLIIILIFVR